MKSSTAFQTTHGDSGIPTTPKRLLDMHQSTTPKIIDNGAGHLGDHHPEFPYGNDQ